MNLCTIVATPAIERSAVSQRRYEGRVAVVTGAASGIGAATATRLAVEGAAVVLADVDERRGREVVDRIETDAPGADVRFTRCDVSDESDWAELATAVRRDHGRVDLLHSNAYLNRVRPLHELARSEWDQILGVSLSGSYLGVRTLLPLLRETRGAVVLTSSVHALVGLPGHPAYAAAKGGLTALGRQLAVEYAPDVRVNVVVPGPIMSPAWDGVDAEGRARSVAATPMARFGEPGEVAAAVAFLGSADASFITGAQLVVDGGWSATKDSS
jgi:NAD(P)-dependent dehydrogenase (short-subunit alcohol dehydrogenase family)